MKLRAILVPVALLGAASLLAVAACNDDDGQANPDDRECCPVSETPQCENFLIGGAKSLRSDKTCSAGLTDNIPSRLARKVDVKGCLYWELDPSSPRTCGVSTPDASGDADAAGVADASDDAGHDASDDSGHDASDDGATDPDASDTGDASDDAEAGDPI